MEREIEGEKEREIEGERKRQIGERETLSLSPSLYAVVDSTLNFLIWQHVSSHTAATSG